MKHAYNRGQFFIDGFLRPGNRFFVPLILVLVFSVLLLISLFIWPVQIIPLLLGALLLFVLGLFLGSLLLGVGIADSFSLAVLGIPFACIYLMGLWRGVFRMLDRRNDGARS